jgi:phage terminase Nu1 subunit (DNA packaging protein)
MDIQTKVIKRIIRVKFPSKEHIDRSKLADLLGVTRSAVTQWLTTGIVDERHIPKLEKIRLEDVWTDRKPYARPRKKGGRNGEGKRRKDAQGEEAVEVPVMA